MQHKHTFAAMLIVGLAACGLCVSSAFAGPYSGPSADEGNAYDPGIAGFVGPDGAGVVSANNYVNPVFVGWADGYRDYLPTSGVDIGWRNAANAVGPVTGEKFHVVSLGDLTASQIAANVAPGQITLTFSRPICNGAGADLAAFENGFVVVPGYTFVELAYVEVSSNGVDFARFPCQSLTQRPEDDDWGYESFDSTDIFGLAGKHANAYGNSWGTPFDLEALRVDPLVAAGQLNLNLIQYVRLVDVVGSGDFLDSQDQPIYDTWETWGSGGFDVEAVGALHMLMPGDTDGSGVVNVLDLAALAGNYDKVGTWRSGDFNGDGVINVLDLASLASNYGKPSVAAGAAAIPEPASLSLLAVAALGLLRRRTVAGSIANELMGAVARLFRPRRRFL